MRKIVMSAVVGLAAMVALAAPVSAGPGDAVSTVTRTDVTFTSSDGVVLHGTVLEPGTPVGTGPRPGVVMLEGAGNRGRGYLMPQAEAYARHGIVTLVYDKRTVGYSMVRRDYGLLAEDALAGVRLLRSRPDVDPGRVGLWALSEGAFVAPIAANRASEVAFVVTVGAVGVTPAAQTAWAYGTYLDHLGVSGSLPGLMQGTVVRTAIGVGVFAEADFDPVPHWEKVRQPVLAQWGSLDRDAVPGESSRLIGAALDRGGNARYTIRFVDGTNHNLHRTAADGFDRLPDLPADYGDVEARWITDPGFTPDPGRAPSDEPATPVIGAPAWYDGVFQLGVMLVLLVAFVAFAWVGRKSRAARWLALCGSVSVVGTLLYVMVLLVTAAKVPGPVLLGRPVAWLGLQLLAVATVVTTVVAAYGLRRPGSRIRLGLVSAAGLVFVSWAVHWGLLIP